MENNKKFQLRFGTLAQYNAATKNANDIYFITDSKQIYVGSTLYTGGFEAVTTFPAAPAQGTLYINTTTGEAKVHNGTAWNVLVPAIDNSINADSTANDSHLATIAGIKAFVEAYVTGQINKIPDVDQYSIVKDATAGEGYSATYHLTKNGVNTGAAINIPKDMVVSSGAVETKAAAGDWGAAGTYLVLTLANATSDKVYINVGSLIEYVTSGSGENDPIQVVVDGSTHKVTASVKNGSLTLAMLHSDVQASLGKADSALQASDITEGATNGTIKVKNTNVAVHGLGSAAYHTDSDFDAAGSAEGVRTTLIGADTDAATADTIKGAKKYADSAASGAIESAAGSGLAHSNGTLSVDVDGTTIVIGTGGKVSAAPATDTHIGAVAIGHTDATEATLAVKLDTNKAAYVDNPMVWKSI